MATGTTLITGALRLLGVIESGETPSDDELDDGLESVNAMLDSWRNDDLMCYALQEESLTLADGDASYTVGSGGDLDTTRPVSIEAAWIVDSDISYTVVIITDLEYAAIPDKTTEADWPDRLVYRPTMATGTIVVYPVPNATRTLKLLTRVPLTALTLADTVSLPPGWERAIKHNLAVEIAPEYQTSAPPGVERIAINSKRSIRKVNRRPVKASTDLTAMFPGGKANILTDQ